MTQNWGDGQPGGYQNYGGLPMAPVDTSQPHVPRPGVVVSAAVLAFVQSGFTALTALTALTTLVMIFVATQRTGSQGVLAQGIWITQAISVAALISGGVLLLTGKNRAVLVAGNALHLTLSMLWIIVAVRLPGVDLDPEDPSGAKGGLVLIAVVFSVLPVISLIQAGLQSVGTWLRYQRGRY
ncbi:hypothetical protein [Actinokineospora sp.]|uniref:hypothetical protein n=1 Tax=Actinokineospora sp. TaxID=1872133 RepID=UPI003D6C6C6E